MAPLFASLQLPLEDMKADLYKKRLLRETMDEEPKCRSFSWKVLQEAKLAVGATTCIGDTVLTAPHFFENVVRGDLTTWEPGVINGTGPSCEDQAAILPTLRKFNNWIVLALAGNTKLGRITLPGCFRGFRHSHDHERKGL